MKTKWKIISGLTLLMNILSLTVFIVLQYDFTDDIKVRNVRNNNFANILNGFRWTSLQTTFQKQTTAVTTDLKTAAEGPCPESSVPIKLLRDGTWLPASTDGHAFVFSAYFVENNNGEIVIIGASTSDVSTFYCQIWYGMKDNASFAMEETPARSIMLPEGHGKRYSAVLFLCSVRSSSTLMHVSLVTGRCNSPSNLLLVNNPAKFKTDKRTFTVCLSPLNFQYSRVHELVEWIELNRILGAEKFIVYNFSSASNVARALDFYTKRGLAEVVQWRLPMVTGDNSDDMHYYGQVAAVNDCLYRNKYLSEFVVNLDLDEFIIPHSENMTSWYEMFRQLKRNAITYIFRNTFFKKEWDNAGVDISNKTKVDKYQLVTLQKLQREKKIFSIGMRTKYITRPLNVSSAMIHTVPSKSSMAVPIEIALVHHYRNWGTKNDPLDAKVLDTTVPDKFGQELITKVEEVWFELNQTEPVVAGNEVVNKTGVDDM